MFHRPLSRPLAVVALLSLFDYLLWMWSLDGNHDIVALVAGLTLVPLLIVLAWLLVKGATRVLAEMTRRTRTISTARMRGNSNGRRGAGRPRTAGGASSATRRTLVGSRTAREQGAAASTDAGEASSKASPSSKLAA